MLDAEQAGLLGRTTELSIHTQEAATEALLRTPVAISATMALETGFPESSATIPVTTPPAERLAVKPFVLEWNETVVREVEQKFLDRGMSGIDKSLGKFVEKSVARLKEEGQPIPVNVQKLLDAGALVSGNGSSCINCMFASATTLNASLISARSTSVAAIPARASARGDSRRKSPVSVGMGVSERRFITR